MLTKSIRHTRWVAWTLAICIVGNLGAYAQDDTQVVEERIIIKTDNVENHKRSENHDQNETIIIEHDGVRREIDIERSGLEDMVERIMDSVESWVDASAEAVERSIESFAGSNRSYSARSDGGNTRDIKISKKAFSNGDIEIRNISGKVIVKGWDRDEIEVEGHLGQDVERLDFDVSSNDATIRVVVPKGRSRKIRSELTVYVPRRNTVEISTVSASIEVDGIQGDDHDMESVSGSIHVRNTSGTMELSSVSGQITVDDADDDLEVSNVSGSIELKGQYPSAKADSVSGSLKIYGAQQRIRAETVSGSMQLYGEELEDISVETVSGSITYTGGLSDRGEIRADSLSGSIRLKLDRAIEGEFDLETFSGSIRCELGPSNIHRTKGKGKHLVFTNGDGKARIRAETFSGSLNIETQ